ncbi:MAG: MATE family efflux transporter [Endozoicomonas sp.]|uniref:MATE family efflux transporter n=1 Tax=Endozoicomonas sp. TaxID=1892382 RepID=UPI003D9B6E47
MFAWPAILSNISVPLLGLVDAGVLGHLSSEVYLAGVAIGSTLFTLVFWAFGFLRMGTTGLVAQALGQNDHQETRQWLAQSILLALLIGFSLILVHRPLLDVALPFFNPAADVAEQARIYFTTRIFSAPAVLINYAIVGWLIGMHRPKGPLLILVLANLVNIILDLLFVLGLGMATHGAALATVIADYTSLVLGIWMVIRTLKGKPGTFVRSMILNVSSMRRLLLLNRHLFVRTLCLLGTQAFFTAQGAQSGSHVLAANALLLNMLLLISNGLDGFAHAAEALTGEALGQRREDRFKQIVRVTGYCSLICAVLFFIVFMLLGQNVIGLLTNIPAVAETATVYLPWLAAMPLFAVWCYWLDGVFIGAVRTDMMQHTMLVSTLLVFLPVWYLTRDMGNHGLWLAYSAFMLARSVGLAIVYRSLSRSRSWVSDNRRKCDE